MTQYIIIRIIQAAFTLLLMTVLVFGLARLTGNPLDLMLSLYATEEDYAAMSHQLGLDRPLPVQYWKFLSGAVHGDMGESLYYKRPALGVVLERFPATLQLAFASLVVSIIISIPIGVMSAVRRDTAVDRAGKAVAVLGQSLPNFWLGILLIELVGVRLELLPTGGRGGLTHLILPAITMGWYVTAGIMRLTRSSMLDVLDTEYVKMARVKGVPEWLVIWKHSLKNALIPVITFTGIIFAQLLVGSIVVEMVFAWPGVGRLAYQAVIQRDFPLLQAIVIAFTAIYIFMNLIVDIAYAYVDPRIRLR